MYLIIFKINKLKQRKGFTLFLYSNIYSLKIKRRLHTVLTCSKKRCFNSRLQGFSPRPSSGIRVWCLALKCIELSLSFRVHCKRTALSWTLNSTLHWFHLTSSLLLIWCNMTLMYSWRQAGESTWYLGRSLLSWDFACDVMTQHWLEAWAEVAKSCSAWFAVEKKKNLSQPSVPLLCNRSLKKQLRMRNE